MRRVKAKQLRKQSGSNREYKHRKKAIKHLRLVKSNVPQNPKQAFKKKHPGESLQDFRDRRKACNLRRRNREKVYRSRAQIN